MATPDGPGRCPHTDGHAWADHLHPRQIPGMARLMELTPELWAHYADPEPTDPTEPTDSPEETR